MTFYVCWVFNVITSTYGVFGFLYLLQSDIIKKGDVGCICAKSDGSGRKLSKFPVSNITELIGEHTKGRQYWCDQKYLVLKVYDVTQEFMHLNATRLNNHNCYLTQYEKN